MTERQATPEPLAFKPDLEEARAHWEAFWAGEILERPCINIRCRKAGAKEVPAPRYMAGAREEFGPVIEQVLAYAETVHWGGDAVPTYTPSFGPDMFGAFLGAELEWSDDEETRTSWAAPCVEDWREALPLKLDPENYWWQRMIRFMRELGQAARGKMLIAHIDMHSNMDALVALRSPAKLCEDLYDCPELVEEANNQVRALFAPVYDELYEAAQMWRSGTTGWISAYHFGKTNTIQCDYAGLVGPEHFRRYILPALEEESSYLEHTVYHYDGPDALIHLDDICALPNLECIQWTPGTGGKPFIEWMDLLKEIQAKGKSVYIPCSVAQIEVYQRELDPAKLFYDCWAKDEDEVQRTLDWLVANS